MYHIQTCPMFKHRYPPCTDLYHIQTCPMFRHRYPSCTDAYQIQNYHMFRHRCLPCTYMYHIQKCPMFRNVPCIDVPHVQTPTNAQLCYLALSAFSKLRNKWRVCRTDSRSSHLLTGILDCGQIRIQHSTYQYALTEMSSRLIMFPPQASGILLPTDFKTIHRRHICIEKQKSHLSIYLRISDENKCVFIISRCKVLDQ